MKFFLNHSRIARAGLLATGLLIGFAGPAQANSSSASVEIRDAARPAAPLTGGDVRFRQLFASWQALDRDTGSNPAADHRAHASPEALSISIPSRMPLDHAHLTSGFGMRNHPVLGGRRRHKGIDLAAPVGTPVHATADGIVGRADRFSSYGLFVKIDHGANLETRYAHMSKLAVAAGEKVRKGDIIGYVGTTGRSTGPHLHYEVRVGGVAVNPAPYMVETKAQQKLAIAPAPGGQGGQGGS